jgi:hypothetical protein
MANVRLNFFNKEGNPLNFDYIGPTGPTPLDSKFTYITSVSGSANAGDIHITDVGTQYKTQYSIELNINDLNGFDLTSWSNEAADFILKGADVYLSGEVAGQQNFRWKITATFINSGSVYVIVNENDYEGQKIISPGNQIYFTTAYDKRPGGHFKGNIYFEPVSAGLYENEQIFIVQEFDTLSGNQYGVPQTGATGATGYPRWRTRWANDNYGETDVSEIIFTYAIQDELSGGDGQPLIVSYPNLVIPVNIDPNSFYTNGYVYTTINSSEAIAVNVATNAPDEAGNIYERKLIVEDITTGTPEKVLEVDYYAEIVSEDERFSVLLENLGRAFYKSDSVILRDHDPAEPNANFLEINEKRKELLVTGEDIFPYIGSYKGLINALKFFGYQDLRIKEYWLNLNYKSLKLESPLQQNQTFLNAIKSQQSKGYSQSYQVGDVLDNENSGKYKLTQTYGPDNKGNYVLSVTSEDSLLPSRTYKKTSLFGLYYDLNKPTDGIDEFGYPVVVDAFKFTQEEVLIKIFALKERLKRDYLPLNARIIDITGEGVYFSIYNTRSWTDVMERFDIESGFDFDFYPNPDMGFIEDLRNFSTRKLSTGVQTPSSYNNSYKTSVDFVGGTGSAISFSNTLPYGVTGYNPTITLTAGNTYEFDVADSGSYGYDFIITTDPLLTQVDPLGILNNGATGGNSVSWYIGPEQTTPVYYYSSNNPLLLKGVINVLTPTISDLGNIVDPLDVQQNYSPAQNTSLLGAIKNFYDLKQNGDIIELGDDRFDPVAYIDPNTGQPYQLPIGMPVILELILDRWQWNELNIDWNALIIPTFKVGDRVQFKNPNAFYDGLFGTVDAVSYSTGTYSVMLDPPYSFSVTVGEAELYSSIQIYNLLTWDVIDFSNMLEIEWILNKSATQNGTPYHFEFRGQITDFYKLAHFLPYTGDYQVICNIYDAFNAKTTIIKNGVITVQPKTVDIDSWTRFREVEHYLWDNVDRGWGDYDSIWEYPAEGESIEILEKSIPREILDFATYGNKSEEGQSLYVKVNTTPIGATGSITFTQTVTNILEIYSLQIGGTGSSIYGYATISTATPHGLVDGDEVNVSDTVSQLNGRWLAILDGSTNTFRIPIALNATFNGITLETTPVNRYVTDQLVYSNQQFGGAGSITIYAGGRLIGTSETGDTLYNTANEITSAINSFRTYPDYFASCLNPTADPVTITISAPNELGADQNGVLLGSVLTGSLVSVSADTVLGNGLSPADTYVYWSENDPDQPNTNLKYWGTKRLNWEVFNSTTWENGYAHSWYDFEFNNDWLGGYELHTLVPGDHVKISTGNSTYPYPVGVTFTNGLSGLTIQEAADQLNNSAEPHITNFYYRPMPSDVGGLSTTSGAVNITSGNHLLYNGPFAPPPSLIGGSQLLIPGFGYTGGNPITSTTTTSTTSTTTTTTILPTTTTTSTSTTTSTTSTSTTSTTTAGPVCTLVGTATMLYPTTTTSTTTTTTLAPTTTTTTTTSAPVNSSIFNQTGGVISGVFIVAVQIGSGSFATVYNSTPFVINIANNSTFYFYQGYYPGAFNTYGNSFRVTVTSASGLTSQALRNTAGSTSTVATFTGTTTATATTFSSTTQMGIALTIT